MQNLYLFLMRGGWLQNRYHSCQGGGRELERHSRERPAAGCYAAPSAAVPRRSSWQPRLPCRAVCPLGPRRPCKSVTGLLQLLYLMQLVLHATRRAKRRAKGDRFVFFSRPEFSPHRGNQRNLHSSVALTTRWRRPGCSGLAASSRSPRASTRAFGHVPARHKGLAVLHGSHGWHG